MKEDLDIIRKELDKLDPVEWGGPNMEHAYSALARLEAFERALRSKETIVIVPAPGDRCGNSKVLANGQPCPGCRVCA